MNPTQGNGLTADNSQPAKTHSSDTLHYAGAERQRKGQSPQDQGARTAAVAGQEKEATSEVADMLDDSEPTTAPLIGRVAQGRQPATFPSPEKRARNPKEKRAIDCDENGAPVSSDIALASAFVTMARFDFRWSPGLAWMVYDGTIWRRDDRMQRYDLAKEVCIRHSSLAKDESDARRIASAKTVAATLALAQADQQLVMAAEIWDRNPMELNTPGGIVDLATGKIRPRFTDYWTQVTRVTPDPKAQCPNWLQFLDSVFKADADLIEFMRRSAGYWTTGNRREQVIHFLYGLGANGKSVLVELLQWLMGSYSLKLPASVLMQAKGERHPTELAQLRGKRLAVSSELDENSYFNESLIKELTGDDTLTARFMRTDFFEFTMTQKHVIVGNFKPRLRGGDPAMGRRMLLVPFNASFKDADRDLHMLDKLKAEGSAILAWIIRGAVDWHQGGLQVPASVRDASAEYMTDHDDLALWMDECCLREGEAKASDLYASFARWKKARGEHAPSQTTWGSRITSLTGIGKRRSNGWRYTGIRLTEHEMRYFDANPF